MGIIGGDYYFFLNDYTYSEDNVLGYLNSFDKQMQLFSTGRDCFFSVFNSIEGKTLWLPDFLCKSIVQPLEHLNINYHFYGIDGSFRASKNNDIRQGDYVLIINYFGFVDSDFYNFVLEKKCNIISDVTHLFFDYKQMGNVVNVSSFIVGSIRKFFAIPDGAFVLSNERLSIRNDTRIDFVGDRAHGLFSRYYSSLNSFDNEENLLVLKQAEIKLDKSPDFGYSISYLSENILKSISPKSYVKRINDNFNFLNAHFGLKYNFFSPYFPLVFFDNTTRNYYRQKLFLEKIFAPIHWDTSFLGNRKNVLSDLILSIPCDYRYDIDDMKRICELIDKSSISGSRNLI